MTLRNEEGKPLAHRALVAPFRPTSTGSFRSQSRRFSHHKSLCRFLNATSEDLATTRGWRRVQSRQVALWSQQSSQGRLRLSLQGLERTHNDCIPHKMRSKFLRGLQQTRRAAGTAPYLGYFRTAFWYVSKHQLKTICYVLFVQS